MRGGGLMQLIGYGAQDLMLGARTGSHLYYQIQRAISKENGEKTLRLLDENPDHRRLYLSEWIEHVLWYGQLEPPWVSAMLSMADTEHDWVGLYLIRDHRYSIAYTKLVVAWLLHHNPSELTTTQVNWCQKTRETFKELGDRFVCVLLAARHRVETRDLAEIIARKTMSYLSRSQSLSESLSES